MYNTADIYFHFLLNKHYIIGICNVITSDVLEAI